MKNKKYTCIKCGIEGEKYFYSQNEYICKECKKAYRKAYYYDHKERILEYQKKYYIRTRSKRLARMKIHYREKNPLA